MATYSQNVSISWGDVPFTEVVGLDWQYAGGSPKGRSIAWTDEAGTVTVAALGTANTSVSEYGLRKQLSISGGGQYLTSYAVWESLDVANEVNGVTRFTVTFKLLDG